MTVAIIAEKPSVARDIARVVGASRREAGCLHGDGHVVTWAIGHLVALCEPHEIRPEWKRWRREQLPMIPDGWPLKVVADTRDQFEHVARILEDPDVDRVVCATDAGREGELIFRYIYERSGCSKPVQRLWISSLTPDAIRAGLAELRDGSEYDPLADAARGRSRADWLVGMNLSRAYTLAYDEKLSVGRVQTPTLAMLVERELAIRAFVPRDYFEVQATFRGRGAAGGAEADYTGTFFDPALEPAGPGRPEDAGERALEARRLPADGERARRIASRAQQGAARVHSVEARQRRLAPPQLYDLTELQRHANRLFGLSAKRTLEIAQALYERHKLISYPRTDSRYLSASVAATLPRVVETISGPYRDQLAPGTGERPLGRRFVDDAKVGDHHAIIPTAGGRAPRLSGDEARLYDLICRRLLAAWHPDHLYSTTTVVTRIEGNDAGEAFADHYRSSGTRVDRPGWKVLDPAPPARRPRETAGGRPRRGNADAAAADQDLPPGLREGLEVEVIEAEARASKTRPPRPFTEATLLTAMETAGRTLDEKELSDAMRERGLGTPATRAAIIETLLQRGYAERRRRAIVATDRGIQLVGVVHDDVKSPLMTGQWEHELARIEAGDADLDGFMRRIETYVTDVVRRVREGGRRRLPSVDPAATSAAAPAARREPAAGGDERPATPPPGASPAARPGPPSATAHSPAPAVPARGSGRDAGPARSPAREPAPAGPLFERGDAPVVPASLQREEARPARAPTPADALLPLLRREFGFEAFRPHQEAVCRALVEGRDALLVMPTGAGKSLCYQLPGLARAGCTLVISPLIALMEDQVAQLQARGLRAERIHSGRDRVESNRVLQAYLDGQLDFLFIAPERLSVPGFPARLAQRLPALIAVDEAHCISQWGHDFRPDYRMLRERLPALRPAPIVALTATATPRVQRDIAEQLGIPAAEQHIHGFRRTNIAVELVEMKPSLRDVAARQLLADPTQRPAIVYAPTRRKAEELARGLARSYPSAAYHAGMAAAARDRVQAAFLGGELEVIVATIAFGMGIDKSDVRTVVHTALPTSVAGYYQEIGRAGRDGQPSRAVLLHSWADRRTHEYFLDRDYPDPKLMARAHDALGDAPEPREGLARRLRLDADEVERALEKLWIHGGARVDADDRVTRGPAADWAPAYELQRAHKREQIEEITRFAQSRECRMLYLVQHFGDREDDGRSCGVCDVCDPDGVRVLTLREPDAAERMALERILEALAERDGESTGRLHKRVFGEAMERRAFERLLGALVRGGAVREVPDSFERDGAIISFRRAHLVDRAGLVHARIAEEPESQRAPSRRRRKADGGKGRRRRSAAPELEANADPALVETLKAWRKDEARRRRVPAFRILTDRVLLGLAAARPADADALLDVRGMGPKLVERYGAALLELLNRSGA